MVGTVWSDPVHLWLLCSKNWCHSNFHHTIWSCNLKLSDQLKAKKGLYAKLIWNITSLTGWSFSFEYRLPNLSEYSVLVAAMSFGFAHCRAHNSVSIWLKSCSLTCRFREIATNRKITTQCMWIMNLASVTAAKKLTQTCCSFWNVRIHYFTVLSKMNVQISLLRTLLFATIISVHILISNVNIEQTMRFVMTTSAWI